MTTLRAYSAQSDNAEASVIVFAPSLSRAVTVARTSPWLDHLDRRELRARREPTLDAEAARFGDVCAGCLAKERAA